MQTQGEQKNTVISRITSRYNNNQSETVKDVFTYCYSDEVHGEVIEVVLHIFEFSA